MTDDATASTSSAGPPTDGQGPPSDGHAAQPESPPAPSESPRASTDGASAAPGRATDLVLAGVHLRLGSLALARAELETLAGRDALDSEGILDLAEARWRTGDVEGAGEAAALVLDDEEGPLVALIVAAEAAAARGRPTEARRLAAKALAAANGTIDRVFAGMPRSPAWPPDPASPPPAPTTMFDPPHGPAAAGSRSARRPLPRRAPAGVSELASAPPARPVGVAPQVGDATIGLWGDESEGQGPVDAPLPSASDALDRGRAALEAGDLAEASIQLALVLRLSSPLAPADLDLVADRRDRELAFVRGDAYRLVGRELDARRAYAGAGPPAPTPASAPTSSAPDASAMDSEDAGPVDGYGAEADEADADEADPDPPYEGDPA
jgi:hypothetical protein